MPERKYKAYSENVAGPFYVECDLCIACRTPEAAAPDLIGFSADPEGTGRVDHCYFKKQPQTQEELDRAVKAVWTCCSGAYHYAGSDREIKEKLRRIGSTEAIDHQ